MSRISVVAIRAARRGARVAAFVLLAAAPPFAPARGCAQGSITFGVVGDFGSGGWGGPDTSKGPAWYVTARAAAGVASHLSGQIGTESFIVSLGDQIYRPWLSSHDEKRPASASDYAAAIGAVYGAYIDYSAVPDTYLVNGQQTSATGMRFFPVLGDHDWWKQQTRDTVNGQIVYEMPGTDNYETYYSGLRKVINNPACPDTMIRYYCIAQGGTASRPLVQLFALSNDPNEALLGSLATADTSAGAWTANQGSPQVQWFVKRLSESQAVWNIAFMHQPPYTTSSADGHPASTFFQFFDWAAAQAGKRVDLVLAGHVHSYERLQNTAPGSSIVYLVNGAGGTFESFAHFCTQPGQSGTNCTGPKAVPGSQVRVYGYYGYQVVTATADYLNIRFYGSQDPDSVLAKQFPDSIPSGATPGQWLLFDDFVILKAGASVPFDSIRTATGVMVQSGTATITGVTGNRTLAANWYGPGKLAFQGGGSITFSGATTPAGLPNCRQGTSVVENMPQPYACYPPPAR